MEASFETSGDKKELIYEGKYDDVCKQIKENKELSEDKKNSLLSVFQNKSISN